MAADRGGELVRVAIALPSMAVITSPVFSPAAAAGPPARTVPIARRCPTAESPTVTPRYACWTALPAIRSSATVLTVLDGTAKPTPALALPPFWSSTAIWTFVPITLPVVSISGPPELPWLIAASVWIVFEIE